jgi:hypothetical protein
MSDQPSVRCGRDSHAPRVVQVRSVDELSRRLGQTLSGGANSAMLQALNQLVGSASRSTVISRDRAWCVFQLILGSADLGNDSCRTSLSNLRNDALRSDIFDGFDRRFATERSPDMTTDTSTLLTRLVKRDDSATPTRRDSPLNRPSPPSRSASPTNGGGGHCSLCGCLRAGSRLLIPCSCSVPMADRSGRPAPSSSRPGFQTVPRPLASLCRRWTATGSGQPFGRTQYMHACWVTTP